jgi:hypothetical protein
MTLPVPTIPRVVNDVRAALAKWDYVEPVPLSLYSRSHTWVLREKVVELSIADSSSVAYVAIAYRVGGAEVAHLVLTDPDQVRPWLRLVGAVLPSQAELAAAMVVTSP